MGWIITFVILFLLAILPLGVSLVYDEDGAVLRVIAGLIRIKVFPTPKPDPDKPPKAKKAKKEKAKPEKKTGAAAAKKKGGSISDFFPFVTMALDFLLDFRNALRFDRVELKLILAGGDPADLAINYGRAWEALGNLWPRLETWFVIKKRNVEVACDFEGSATTILARVDLTITLGRVIALLVRYGIRGIKEFLNFRKKRNGGTTV